MQQQYLEQSPRRMQTFELEVKLGVDWQGEEGETAAIQIGGGIGFGLPLDWLRGGGRRGCVAARVKGLHWKNDQEASF